jgi:hypothetical protein
LDKSVTIKFWQLYPSPGGGLDFGESLRLAFEEDEAKRFREIDECWYCLSGAKGQTGNVLSGDAIRLQGEALPSRIKVGEKPHALTLGADVYLGHHTGFIYDKKYSLIGFEIKPAAAGLQKLLSLVAEISKQQPCIPVPVLTKNAVAQLTGTKNGTFKFKIADPVTLSAVDPDLGSYRDSLVALKEMVDGAYVNVAIGVGPRRDGLKKEKLRKLVNWLLNEKASDRGKVRTLKVIQPHEQDGILDFIKAQVKSKAVLNIVGDPDKDWVERRKNLTKALAEARQHVKPISDAD